MSTREKICIRNQYARRQGTSLRATDFRTVTSNGRSTPWRVCRLSTSGRYHEELASVRESPLKFCGMTDGKSIFGFVLARIGRLVAGWWPGRRSLTLVAIGKCGRCDASASSTPCSIPGDWKNPGRNHSPFTAKTAISHRRRLPGGVAGERHFPGVFFASQTCS
jgi:hypothetical protein